MEKLVFLLAVQANNRVKTVEQTLELPQPLGVGIAGGHVGRHVAQRPVTCHTVPLRPTLMAPPRSGLICVICRRQMTGSMKTGIPSSKRGPT